MKIILGIVVILAALLVIRLKLSGSGTEKKPRPKQVGRLAPSRENGDSHDFRAVSIRPPTNACAAAQACNGKKFLRNEAPIVPLEGCTLADCRCRYQHHADRRDPENRRDDFNPNNRGYTASGSQDRRTRRGRRQEDRETSSAPENYEDLLNAATRDKE